MTIRQWRLLGRTVFVGGAATAGLWLGWAGITSLAAQAPNAGLVGADQPPMQEAAPVQRNYMRQGVIDLPINMKDEARALIQEIHLYVKEQATAPWTLRDKGNASATTFRFQTPRDGEYSFMMVTVDKQGRSFPKDLQNEPAGLVVVIDSQRPTVELTNYGDAPEGQLIHSEVKDANVDNARVRFYFQGGDKVFRSLDSMPGRAGTYCIPAQAVSTGLVRLVAEDMAGNQTVCEEHVNKLPTRNVSAGGTQQVNVVPPMKSVGQKKPGVIPVGVGEPQEPNPPAPPTLPSLIEDPVKVAPVRPIETENPRFPMAAEEPIKVSTMRPDGTDNPRFLDESTIASSRPLQANPLEKLAPLPPPVAPVEQPILTPPPVKNVAIAKRQVVNNHKVYLDYQIDNAVGNNQNRVEVWLTRDQGKTWQKHADDAARKSPIEVALPGEGVFGLMLAATTGRPSTAPTGGDAADMWIEVDTTKPAAQITGVKVSHDKGQSSVDIQWSVTDTNLGDGPVELYYAPTVQGKWLPIAKGLKAQGQHRWTPPVEIGGSAHVRLIARDAAGNTSICDTVGAVTLEDPTRPRITIRSVRTEAPIATPAAPAPFQIIQPGRGN